MSGATAPAPGTPAGAGTGRGRLGLRARGARLLPGRGRPGAGGRGPVPWVAVGTGATVVAVLALALTLGGGGSAGREVRDPVALVAGFPAQVVVVDGTVVESRSLGDRASTATVEVAGAGEQAAALALLEDGAFTRTGEVDRDGVRSYSLVSADLGVTVVLKESGGVPVVTYTVAPRG